MSNPQPTGVLPLADRLSKVGLWAGAILGGSLALADLVAWIVAKQVILVSHFHSLALVVIVLAIVCSLMVQLAARIIRWLRRVAYRLEEPGRGYPEGFADGLARRPARSLHLVESGLDPS